MAETRVRQFTAELTASSMLPATIVGLVAIPVGFLGIYLWGTGSAIVMLLAGVAVGVLYNRWPVPAYRAGARAGIFAPLPEVVVQTSTEGAAVVEYFSGAETTAFFVALIGLMGLALWVIGASVCIAAAFATDWVLDLARAVVSEYDELPG